MLHKFRIHKTSDDIFKTVHNRNVIVTDLLNVIRIGLRTL